MRGSLWVARLTPVLHAPDGKGVTQVMQTWRIVRAAIDPAQAVTQRGEDAMCLPFAQRLSQSAARLLMKNEVSAVVGTCRARCRR